MKHNNKMIKFIVPLGFLISLFFADSVYALTGTEIYNKVKKSVVIVYVFQTDDMSKLEGNLKAFGSGVAVKHNVIATNCHVALAGGFIAVIKEGKSSRASLIFANKSQDICLLKLDDMTLVPVPLRPSDDLMIGEEVYAIGNPDHIENYLSKGLISKIEYDKGNTWILTDVTTTHGSSGGGLFDTHGNLVGITSLVSKKNANISFSASIDWIIQKLNIQPQYKKVADERKEILSEPEPRYPQRQIQNNHGFQLIGTYGDSNISLYQYQNSCFIYLPGRRVSGLITSAAIWFPQTKQLILYPYSKNIEQVLQTLDGHYNKYDSYSKKYNITKNKLLIDEKYYDLYTKSKYNFSEHILEAALDKKISAKFIEGSQFILYLWVQKKSDYIIRVFGLWGFSEALLNYYAKCLQSNQ